MVRAIHQPVGREVSSSQTAEPVPTQTVIVMRRCQRLLALFESGIGQQPALLVRLDPHAASMAIAGGVGR